MYSLKFKIPWDQLLQIRYMVAPEWADAPLRFRYGDCDLTKTYRGTVVAHESKINAFDLVMLLQKCPGLVVANFITDNPRLILPYHPRVLKVNGATLGAVHTNSSMLLNYLINALGVYDPVTRILIPFCMEKAMNSLLLAGFINHTRMIPVGDHHELFYVYEHYKFIAKIKAL